MAKAIHSMIRVFDENKSVDFYSKAFNLGIKDRFDFDGFTLVYLKNEENDFEIELTINHNQPEPYSTAPATAIWRSAWMILSRRTRASPPTASKGPTSRNFTATAR